MKASTAIGIGVAFGSLMMSSLMGGTSPASFIDIPALMIILGGTGGVTLASVGMASMKRVPSLYKMVFSAEPPDMRGQLDQLVSLADKARREGLLALDAQLVEIDDAFTRNALQLVVDGTDPEMVHAILEAEVDGMAARHAASARRRSRRPAGSLPRWASSARSSASCTCSRTSPRPPRSGLRSPPRSSPP